MVMMALGAIEALTISYLDGLWLVLIGWSLISAIQPPPGQPRPTRW
jgi:hypothetical protein